MPTKYLALDPGESSGWAAFDEDGNLILYDTCYSRESVYNLLDDKHPRVIIMEDFKLYPNKAKEQSWSSFETVRLIGAVEHWAWQNNVEVILQPANIKSVAYLWAGISPPKQHSMTHETDAYVHGIYYLQKSGIRKPQQGNRGTRI